MSAAFDSFLVGYLSYCLCTLKDQRFCRNYCFYEKKKNQGIYSVKHWIPYNELQNARGCRFELEWTSIRLGDLLRSSIKEASNTHYSNLREHLVVRIKRHLKEIHDEDSSITIPKQYVCQETGCAKVFKYASKLRKHEESHVKLDSVEAFCSEQGCMKYFTNKQCLEVHIRSCHQHITCEICGSRQLKKNIKQHLLTHEERGPSERFKCEFKGCLLSSSAKSNLQQHVKAVHHEIKPFSCGHVDCGIRFAYKHVRDKHEKSGRHVYATGILLSQMSNSDQGREVGGRGNAQL
ncbi:hypothetical protein Q3G72_007520 [Acer saccharum]|nr:hypothetical protein Q3G72_007520 [Acer saccharum]